jgi:hypothetical protein
MTTRRLLFGLLLLSSLLACGAGWLWIDDARQMFGVQPTQGDDPLIVDDPLVAKYRLIHEGMTYEEAVQLLGLWVDECHPGITQGDHIYTWKNTEGTLEVTWDAEYRLAEASVTTTDGKVLSRNFKDERRQAYRRRSWKRWLSRFVF